VTKEMSTLNTTRPTILDEKRRIQRELGLAVDPSIVMPRTSRSGAYRPSKWKRFTAWVKGAPL
jgi:hypothetical protein